MITTVLWRELFLSWASRMPPKPAESAAAAPYLSTSRRPGRSIMDSSGIQLHAQRIFAGLVTGRELELNLNSGLTFFSTDKVHFRLLICNMPRYLKRISAPSPGREASQCGDTILV